MTETKESKSLMDKFSDVVTRISGPLTKLASFPFMQAIQQGFAATLPILMFGSIFLIIQSAVTGQLGFKLFGGLAAYSDKFLIPYQLGTGFLAFYATLAIGIHYAKNLGIKNTASVALIVVSFFFFINFNTVDGGLTDLTAFSSSGAFAGMVAAFVSVRLYKFFLDKNITIRMPESVPPMIASAFTDLIPTFCILGLAWIIRTCLNFNFTTFVMTALTPVLKFGDSFPAYAGNAVLSGVFWSVGIHWENMVSGIVTPMTQTFLAENAAAFVAGTPLNQLPHIWAAGANIMSRAATHYPLIVLLLRSKVPGFKEVGKAGAIPAIFCVCEPLTFGIPMVMNPYMSIPLILSNLAYAIISWAAYSLHLVNRVYASAPWASPLFLNLMLSTGDWKMIIVVLLCFIAGLIIYTPFFRAYEKSALKEMEAKKVQQ